MLHVVLYQPEIPPNTGNIIRLCANSSARLHLIHPLGFTLEDRQLRRAGLDYHEFAPIEQHADWQSYLDKSQPKRIFAVTTRGAQPYHQVQYRADDALLFGPETQGVPESLLQSLPPEQRLRIPMAADSRSLNLSNAVAIVLYEAWRQLQFAGGS